MKNRSRTLILFTLILGISNLNLNAQDTLLLESKPEVAKKESKFIETLKSNKKILGISAAVLVSVILIATLGYNREKIENLFNYNKEKKRFFIDDQEISEEKYNLLLKKQEEELQKKLDEEKRIRDEAAVLLKQQAEERRIAEERAYKEAVAERANKQAQAWASWQEQVRKEEEAKRAAQAEKERIRQGYLHKLEQERLASEQARQECIAKESLERELAQQEKERIAQEEKERIAKESLEKLKELNEIEADLIKLHRKLNLADIEYVNLGKERDIMTSKLLENPTLASKYYDLNMSVFNAREKLGEIERKVDHEERVRERLKIYLPADIRAKKDKEYRRKMKIAQNEKESIQAKLKKKAEQESIIQAAISAQKLKEKEAKIYAERKENERRLLRENVQKAKMEPGSSYLKNLKKREKRKARKNNTP